MILKFNKMAIGFIGGTGYASTIYYYRQLNERLLRKNTSNRPQNIVLYSLDFQYYKHLAEEKASSRLDDYILQGAQSLKRAGVDSVALLAVTLHQWAGLIERETGLPVIHIGDSISKELTSERIEKVLFLGTHLSMEEGFITNGFAQKGIQVVTPNPKQRAHLHEYIYQYLSVERTTNKGQTLLTSLVREYETKVDGIVLGCTELPMAFSAIATNKPVFSSTDLHIKDIFNHLMR